MATPLIPSEGSLFVARADWREVSEYPEASLRDPSIWAWELLRRNRSYARDYDALHHRVRDVPPTPFPKMSLDGYHCVPDALSDDTRSSYLARHPNGTILPIIDHIREIWGINELKDPNSSAIELATERSGELPDNRLAWLFACNTVEVINPPTTWPTKNYLQFVRLSTLVSAHCTGTEMLVRLDFTGNLDEQLRALRREVSGFFDGGTRSGKRLVERKRYPEDDEYSYDESSPQIEPSRQGDSSLSDAFLAVKPDWNTRPIVFKTLQNVTRMVDALGALDAGVLEAQLGARRGNLPGINVRKFDLSIDWKSVRSPLDYVKAHGRVRRSLHSALLSYLQFHPFLGAEPDFRQVETLLNHAYQAVSGGYLLVAKLDPKQKD